MSRMLHPSWPKWTFKNVCCNINSFFTINIVVYYSFNRVQNNISHPHIGGKRWVYLNFTDIYMPISMHVTSMCEMGYSMVEWDGIVLHNYYREGKELVW